MASFEEINYNIRANKSIERKMIAEVIQKLSFISDLENYRYIGLGSTYFTDFTLFHKGLGIKNMISIEKEESKKERFEFNKPFSCIKMEYGDTSTVLPNLELDKHLNIIWLDYDGVIEDYVFSDLDSIVSTCLPGTLFLISINVECSHGSRESRTKELIERIGKEKIPAKYLDQNLNNITFPKLAYEMIDTQIRKSLLERTRGNSSILDYSQLFHYLYKDGAQMLTIGGILFDNKQSTILKKINFNMIEHCSFDNEPFRIKCPNLTYKEINYLNNLLPCELEISKNGNIQNKDFKKLPLNQEDIKRYAKVYRYFPNFSEVNI